MKCKDKSVNYLKSFGYNIVRLPRADISPLQIIIRAKRNFELLGDLATVLVPGANIALPTVDLDVPTASISGKSTSDLSVGVGLSILGNIIGAMGGSKIGIDGQFSNARTVAFEFQDVLTDSIQVTQLDKFLTNADLDPFSKHVNDLLESDDIYIITSVIKSNSFNVAANSKNDGSLSLDVPAIQQVVGANIKVSSNTDNSTSISFNGTIPLIFGFKAVRLTYDDGKYTAFESIEGDGGPLSPLSNVDNSNVTWLMDDAPMINLTSN